MKDLPWSNIRQGAVVLAGFAAAGYVQLEAPTGLQWPMAVVVMVGTLAYTAKSVLLKIADAVSLYLSNKLKP